MRPWHVLSIQQQLAEKIRSIEEINASGKDVTIREGRVFSKREWKNSSIVARYKGEKLSERDLEKRYDENEPAPYVLLRGDAIVDARDPRLSNWTRYVTEPDPGQAANVAFAPDDRGSKIYMYALRHIRQGDQITWTDQPIKQGDQIIRTERARARIKYPSSKSAISRIQMARRAARYMPCPIKSATGTTSTVIDSASPANNSASPRRDMALEAARCPTQSAPGTTGHPAESTGDKSTMSSMIPRAPGIGNKRPLSTHMIHEEPIKKPPELQKAPPRKRTKIPRISRAPLSEVGAAAPICTTYNRSPRKKRRERPAGNRRPPKKRGRSARTRPASIGELLDSLSKWI